MKRNNTSRLLTSAMMDGLVNAAQVRDGGCLYHQFLGGACGGGMDFHHVIEQTWIKNVYGKLGGIRFRDENGFSRYRPKTRFEFVEPNISATQIACDLDTGICLCRAAHNWWPQLRVSERLDIVDERRADIRDTAIFYSLDAVFERRDPMFWKGLLTA